MERIWVTESNKQSFYRLLKMLSGLFNQTNRVVILRARS